jgi:hypothetical protein
MNADGSNLARLTNNDVWDVLPAWSPDGFEDQRLAILRVYTVKVPDFTVTSVLPGCVCQPVDEFGPNVKLATTVLKPGLARNRTLSSVDPRRSPWRQPSRLATSRWQRRQRQRRCDDRNAYNPLGALPEHVSPSLRLTVGMMARAERASVLAASAFMTS